MTKRQYQAVEDFLMTYFHQDWSLDHQAPEDVVRQYLADSSREQIQALLDGLRALLRDAAFTADPQQVLFQLGCYYNSQFLSQQPADWIQDLIVMLEERLGG